MHCPNTLLTNGTFAVLSVISYPKIIPRAITMVTDNPTYSKKPGTRTRDNRN